MYKNSANLAKNRLYSMVKGKATVTELQAWAESCLGEARKLKPGFGVVSDIGECQPTTEEGRLIIQKVQRTCLEMGMAHVVRIVKGANPITVNQWQRTSRSLGYLAAEADSQAAADKLLDDLEK